MSVFFAIYNLASVRHMPGGAVGAPGVYGEAAKCGVEFRFIVMCLYG